MEYLISAELKELIVEYGHACHWTGLQQSNRPAKQGDARHDEKSTLAKAIAAIEAEIIKESKRAYSRGWNSGYDAGYEQADNDERCQGWA